MQNNFAFSAGFGATAVTVFNIGGARCQGDTARLSNHFPAWVKLLSPPCTDLWGFFVPQTVSGSGNEFFGDGYSVFLILAFSARQPPRASALGEPRLGRAQPARRSRKTKEEKRNAHNPETSRNHAITGRF